MEKRGSVIGTDRPEGRIRSNPLINGQRERGKIKDWETMVLPVLPAVRFTSPFSPSCIVLLEWCQGGMCWLGFGQKPSARSSISIYLFPAPPASPSKYPSPLHPFLLLRRLAATKYVVAFPIPT